MASPADFDPFAPETVENPHAFFRALRKQEPVCPLRGGQWTVVSRRRDIEAVAMDPRTFSSNLVGVLIAGNGDDAPMLLEMPAGGPRPVDALAIADPPAHPRQRKLVNAAFSMRRIKGLEPRLRQLASQLFDAFEQESEVEWMEAVARPLPMLVICELLGFPAQDADQLERWSTAGIALLSGLATAAEIGANSIQVAELGGYIAARFAEAKTALPDDVMGDLARASQATNPAIGDDEAVAILLQLLIAGQETTTSLLGGAVRLLAEDPALQARLRAEAHKVPTFIEETVRLESPFYGHFRVANEDTELAGCPVSAGTRLMLLWGSGNRDGDESLEHVDLDRDKPRDHLSFGHGIHYCIGAELARLEARVVIETLLERTASVALACDAGAVRHRPSLFVRRLERLPLRLRR